jgi:protein-arginine kinase activator protein McsA
MDINSIKTKYDSLNKELKDVLSRMERTDKVFTIRDAIKDLQKICPHDNGSFDFSTTDYCPYCGRKFGK